MFAFVLTMVVLYAFSILNYLFQVAVGIKKETNVLIPAVSLALSLGIMTWGIVLLTL